MKFRMHVRVLLAATILIFVAGCHDVEYDYNIPEGVSDCPSGLKYRSSGAGIVDRSSGAGIVDRNDDSVMAYCYVDNCSGTWDNSVAASIDWHQDDHEVVVAKRRCIASAVPPVVPPPSNPPVPEGDSDTTTDTDQQ